MKMRKELWLTVLALAAVAGLLAPDALANGRRLVVQMDEPFEVSGQLYAAGELSICEVQAFNPIATLNEVRVDGQSLGILLARSEDTTRVARNDEVIFLRNADGHLVLTSVGLAGEPVRRLYNVGETAPKAFVRASSSRSLKLALAK